MLKTTQDKNTNSENEILWRGPLPWGCQRKFTFFHSLLHLHSLMSDLFAFQELPSDWEVRQDKRLLVFLTIAHNNVIKEMRKYDILVKTPQVSGRFFRMGFHLAGSSILRNLIIGNYVRILLLAPSNEKSL